MIDLAHLFSKLVTPQGKILVPGIMDKVMPLTGMLCEACGITGQSQLIHPTAA